MATLDELYEFVDDSGIGVFSFENEDARSLSCLTRKVACFIAINPMLLESSTEEIVLLAHEIGHCETGSFYNEDNLLDIRGRHEYRTNRWATERLILWENLIYAFENGIIEVWALAERFNVTEDFIHIALDIYAKLHRQGRRLPRPLLPCYTRVHRRNQRRGDNGVQGCLRIFTITKKEG
jgi:hypothetical protein